MNDDKVLVLRTCANNMSDHCGQIWPVSGVVECKYWEPTRKLENGLAGLLWGKGASTHLNMQADARWVICEVAVSDIIFLDAQGGVKFPRAEVVHVGTRNSAAGYISANIASYASSTVALNETFVFPEVRTETK